MINASHERHVVCCKGIPLLDSLERDQPGRGHWVLRVGISRVILKFLGEEIDNFLLLEIYERQVVRQSDPVLVDLCGCLSDST